MGSINFRHIRLITLNSIYVSLRGGAGIVFLLFAMSFGLLTAHMILTSIEQAQKAAEINNVKVTRKQVVEQVTHIARDVITFLIPGGRADDDLSAKENAARRKAAERWTSFLVDDNPAVLSAIMMVLLFGLPFIVVTGAFNLFSSDIQHRGLRYLLLRTERSNLFFGRFLGSTLFCVATMAVTMAIIVFYMSFKLDDLYKSADLWKWGVQGFAAMALLTLPYVALCAWLSGSIDSPFASLTVCSLVVGLVPVFALWGGSYWEPLKMLNYLLPFWSHAYLLHPDASVVWQTAAGALGYTAAFLAIGHWQFCQRDL